MWGRFSSRRRRRLILAHLEVASRPTQMGLPGLQLHALKGDLAGFWSVSVSGSWRIIFRFAGGHVTRTFWITTKRRKACR